MAAITQFLGLFTNADPSDIPRGAAQQQDNLWSRKAGCLQVRNGLSLANSEGTAAFTQLYAYYHANHQYLIGVNASGEVRSILL